LEALQKKFDNYKIEVEKEFVSLHHNLESQTIQPTLKKSPLKRVPFLKRNKAVFLSGSQAKDQSGIMSLSSQVLHDMLLGSDQVKVLHSMGSRFEKMIGCEQIFLLRFKGEHCLCLNHNKYVAVSSKQSLLFEL